MTKRIQQPARETFRVQVALGGKEEIMSLQRSGNLWTLEGEGISGTARTAGRFLLLF